MSTKRLVSAAALTLCSSAAWAVPMTESDSSAFTYRYEMEVDPISQDLDGDTNADWSAHSGIPTFAGGVATLTGSRFNGTGNSIWQSSGISAAAAWTIEIRATFATGTTPGNDRNVVWGINPSTADGALDYFVEVGEDQVHLVNDSSSVSFESYSTPSNSAQFINLRMAQDADGFWVWRNEQLLNDGAYDGINHTAIINRLLVGTYSGRLPGPFDIEYLRLTSGAFAPVGQVIPEPASLALLGSGTLLLLRRRV